VACFQALFEHLKQKNQTGKTKTEKEEQKIKKQKLYNQKVQGKNRLFMQGARDGSKPAVKPVS
jgi:hypothetical protein